MHLLWLVGHGVNSAKSSQRCRRVSRRRRLALSGGSRRSELCKTSNHVKSLKSRFHNTFDTSTTSAYFDYALLFLGFALSVAMPQALRLPRGQTQYKSLPRLRFHRATCTERSRSKSRCSAQVGTSLLSVNF